MLLVAFEPVSERKLSQGEQGHLRKHVVIYVDGERLHDRTGLMQALHADGEVYVMQALSGG